MGDKALRETIAEHNYDIRDKVEVGPTTEKNKGT